MSGAAPADQSMEDILASIRRILNDEDKPADGAARADAPATDPASPPDQAEPALPPDQAEAAAPPAPAVVAPPPMAEAPPPDDTLVLTEDMMVSAPPTAEAPPSPSVPSPGSLLAPAVAAAATASVSRLLNTVASERGATVSRGGPSIEDVVREELRPLLKSWLDQHLPGMVERLVRAEIERVVGRALS